MLHRGHLDEIENYAWKSLPAVKLRLYGALAQQKCHINCLHVQSTWNMPHRAHLTELCLKNSACCNIKVKIKFFEANESTSVCNQHEIWFTEPTLDKSAANRCNGLQEIELIENKSERQYSASFAPRGRPLLTTFLLCFWDKPSWIGNSFCYHFLTSYFGSAFCY